MKLIPTITAALALIAAISMTGCKSKQEASRPASVAPQQKAGDVKSISGEAAAGAVAVSPKDKADGEAVATRVLAQMEAGEFSAIYKEAAPGFKAIGAEELFVNKFQQTRQKTGPLMNPKEMSAVSRPDKTLVLVYRMENERFTSDRRLTFARSKSGKMELFGLNQHDEPKQGETKK